MNLQNVEFVKSAATHQGFIYDELPQIVFAGRSNVGKSSVINKLLGRRDMARTSSSPGKTAHVNYFLVGGKAYFVDLPGYGHAKVSKGERDRWSDLMEAFFSDAGQIALGVMIVDARHKPTADDVTMAEWFKGAGCNFVVVANKIDKVKKGAVGEVVPLVRETLGLQKNTGVVVFSALEGINKGLLLDYITSAVKQNTIIWNNAGSVETSRTQNDQ